MAVMIVPKHSCPAEIILGNDLLIRVIAVCLSRQGMCSPLWYDDANWAAIELARNINIFPSIFPRGDEN